MNTNNSQLRVTMNIFGKEEMEETNSQITINEGSDNLKEFVEKNYHKVRKCFEYYDEYRECSSIKGRFHQYFIFGEYLDCSKWKSDLDNCEKARVDKDKHLKELASIIHHEDERREERLKNHLQNDVWPRRTEPPPNWNGPLPEWFIEKQEISEKLIPTHQCVIS